MRKLLIIYQHREREYDNALLLKVYFECRGWRVDIKNDAAEFSLFKRYDCYMFPCLYDNNQLNFLKFRFNVYDKPILNLRYEQVCTKYDLIHGTMVPKEIAQNIHAINWGSTDYMNCVDFGMDKSKLHITGHIALDFLRKDFRDFWKTKDEILKQYNLSNNKKIVCFISTLALADDSDLASKSENFFDNSDDVKKSYEFHSDTRKLLLNWFDKYLQDNEDVCIIYRPHPSERADRDLLRQMNNKYLDRFRIIREENVKQWFLVSDAVLFWMSTSIVECYAARKNCLILRPEEITIAEGWDAMLYENANSIKNYSEFSQHLQMLLSDNGLTSFEFPIDDEIILANYDISDIPSYERIAEVISEIIDSDTAHCSRIIWFLKRWCYLIKNYVLVRILGKKIYAFFYSKFGIKISNENIRKKFAVEHWENDVDNQIFNRTESKQKIAKLKKIVDRRNNL